MAFVIYLIVANWQAKRAAHTATSKANESTAPPDPADRDAGETTSHDMIDQDDGGGINQVESIDQDNSNREEGNIESMDDEDDSLDPDDSNVEENESTDQDDNDTCKENLLKPS